MAFRSDDGRLWFDAKHEVELFQVGTRVRIVKSEVPSSLPNGREHKIIEDPGGDRGEDCPDTGTIDADGDFQVVFVREAEIIDSSEPESENVGGEADAVVSDESMTIKVADYSAECWPVGTRVKIRPDIALTDDHQKFRWIDQIDKVFVVEAPGDSDVVLRPHVRSDIAFKWRFVLADDAPPAPAPAPTHAATPPMPEFDTTQQIGDNVHTTVMHSDYESVEQYKGERCWCEGCIVVVDMLASIEEPLLAAFDFDTEYEVSNGGDWCYVHIKGDYSYEARIGDIHGGTPSLVRWFNLISPPKKDDTDG